MIRPQLFGKYILLERINVGGMAEVYRAKPVDAPGFKRFLAVKRILPNLAEDSEFVEMFVEEAKISVQLNHKQVCQIYELGRLNESYYIVMEYIAGRDLLALQNHFRKQKKIMSVTQAAFIAAQICVGLDYAHRKKTDDGRAMEIIHRDISPQNVLISFDGEVKVIDFGIARAATKNKQTQVGVLKGKFGYMSPEQVAGEVIDRRSDVFAVGTLLWEMLTARRLFYAKTDFATLEKVRSGEILPPSAKNKRVPAELDRIVLKALERDRDKRYQWAGDFADDLLDFLMEIRPPYTEKTLSSWMVANFAERLNQEREKVAQFRQFVSAKDVEAYNDDVYEVLDDDDLLEDVEDATRVWDSGSGAAMAAAGSGEVLAENEAEPMATVVMSTEDMHLPDAPSSGGRRQTTGKVLRPDLQLSGQYAAVPMPKPRRSFGAKEAVLLILLLAVLGVGGFVAYQKFAIPTTGTLVIDVDSVPGMSIAVDGEMLDGTPPLTIEGLPEGTVYVEIKHDDYEDILEPVEVVAGSSTEFSRTLVPLASEATVRLNLANPEAQVYLDGQLIGGNGADREFTAESGRDHIVEVYLEGHVVKTYEFDLDRNEEFERDVELEPVAGTIRVTPSREGTVYLDDEEQGDAGPGEPVVIEGLDVMQVYELRIEPGGAGFQDFEQTIVFDTYYDLRLNARIRRFGEANEEAEVTYGFLTTGEGDRWYRVFVDGRDTGLVTPIEALEGEDGLPLKTGNRTISFVRSGDSRDVQIVVNDGEAIRVNVPDD